MPRRRETDFTDASLSELVRCIGRQRLERVGQGVLKFAIENDAGVRRAFGLDVKSSPVAEVGEEVNTASGWRADLVAYDASGNVLTRIELKLGAPLTLRQKEASIDWLVVPTDRAGQSEREPGNVKAKITWRRLADRATDRKLVAPLLRSLDRMTAEWWREEITCEEVVRGLRSGNPDTDLKPFLGTLDVLLSEKFRSDYLSHSAWSANRRSGVEPYVGYCFTFGKSPALWVGFSAMQSGSDAWLQVGTYWPEKTIDYWPKRRRNDGQHVWNVKDAARVVVAALRKSYGPRRRAR